VVVGFALHDIEFANFFRVFADDLFSLVAVDLFPSVVGIDFDSLGHVVPVEAHSGHEEAIVLVSELLMVA